MDLSSKFSLYDFLAMIIPGGIILAILLISYGDSQICEKSVTYCCGCQTSEFSVDVVQSVIFLVASYFIGMINNWFCDGFFKGFRNFPFAIENALINTIRSNGNMDLHKIVDSTYDNSKDGSRCLCCVIIKTLGSILCKLFPCKKAELHKSVVSNYYKAYYSLSKKKLLGSVPLIESQVSLLRNSLIPTILLACMLRQTMSGCCVWLAIGLIILMFVVMVQRQQKVYRMIWESYNYYMHHED